MTQRTKRIVKLQVVTFPAKKVRIHCPKHGLVGIQTAYDPFLKAMTAMSCEKCPTITAPKKVKNKEGK